MTITNPVDQLGGPNNAPTTDALLVSVIDRSGSMQNEMAAVHAGYNTLIADQAKLPGCRVSTIIFDTIIDVLQVGAPAAESLKLDNSNCYARGGTALHDAVAAGINGAAQWLTRNPTFKGKVIVSISTDGEENSSVEYGGKPGLDRLNALINEKKAAGWEFLFLGSGESGWLAGKGLSTAPLFRTVAGASQGVYAGVSTSYTTARMGNVSVASTLASNLAANNALAEDEDDA